MKVTIHSISSIIKVLGPRIYTGARTLYNRYPQRSFLCEKTNTLGDENVHEFIFRIPDIETPQTSYNVSMNLSKMGEVTNAECDCHAFYEEGICIHIGVALLHLNLHSELLQQKVKTKEDNFHKLLSEFTEKRYEKQRAYVSVTLIFHEDIYSKRRYVQIELKIGTNKMYQLKKHVNDFFEAYCKEEGEVYFGKDFTYNSKIHIFDYDTKQLLNYLASLCETPYAYKKYDEKGLMITGKKVNQLFSFLINQSFSIDLLEEEILDINKIETECSLPFEIKKGKYVLEAKICENDIYPLTEDYEYMLFHKKCYFVKEENREIIQIFSKNMQDGMTFTEADMFKFNTVILPRMRKISNNIQIDKELEKDILLLKPITRYYLDIVDQVIICHLKFLYKEIEVSYFAPITSANSIIRDEMIEEEAKKCLLWNGFIQDSQKECFFLNQVEKIVSFKNYGLQGKKEDDQVFVSSKLKHVQLLKKPMIKSTISLGSADLLECHFESDIPYDEMEKIVSSIKLKQKYYLLKSGDILSLENSENISAFTHLMKSLDISLNELQKDKICYLPQYYALYLEDERKQENENMLFSKEVKTMIKKIRSYQNLEVTWNEKVDIYLRDYQQLGVKWFLTLAECNFGGILADEMGLGKTLQTICYIKHRLTQKKTRKFLIISPTSLIYNWQTEFSKFTEGIRVKIINDERKLRQEELKNITLYDVIVTSYGLLRQDIEAYQDILFDTCIIDEAQNIKNLNTGVTKAVKQIKASIRFALTGTPIENSLLELYSIFDFIMPGYFKTTTHFKEHFSDPIIKDQDEKTLHRLNRMVAPFILRRKKSMVLKELPDKIERQVTIELKEEQKQLYLSYLELAKKEVKDMLLNQELKKNRIKILSILTRLRQICIDPSLFVENYNGGSAKMEAVVELIKSAISEQHKILIFSQFTSALEILRTHLRREKITSYYIDGNMKAKERLNLVNSFNSDDTHTFLISLKAGGTGLNLTSADIVIHLDSWWNPAVENQATDRAHRIGQKKVVEVIKLIANGTIEEKILTLQQKKQKLSDEIVDAKDRDTLILSSLNEDDIKELLNMSLEG